MNHHIGQITDFYLDNNFAVLHDAKGNSLTVHFNNCTGKVVTRKKTNKLSSVQHPGIYLGKTNNGTTIILHNHYAIGHPSAATLQQYSRGEKVSWDNRKCNVSRLEIVASALRQIKARKRYHLTNYNCQHYVNIACIKKQKSESVDNVRAGFGIAASFVAVVGIIGLISR